ncbi:MAG: response regulator [Terracidiphilus sp.]|jgi:DNA-binding response OmpR family regulator
MHETKANLLIVDDDPSVLSTLSLVLAETGYRVRTAQDGSSAWNAIGDESPEIVLSDLNMPGMSGFELLTKVRRQFPAIRTVAMSGAFSGEEVPNGVAADAFYQKGSSLASLLRVIESLPWRERRPTKLSAESPEVMGTNSGSESSQNRHLTDPQSEFPARRPQNFN